MPKQARFLCSLAISAPNRSQLFLQISSGSKRTPKYFISYPRATRQLRSLYYREKAQGVSREFLYVRWAREEDAVLPLPSAYLG